MANVRLGLVDDTYDLCLGILAVALACFQSPVSTVVLWISATVAVLGFTLGMYNSLRNQVGFRLRNGNELWLPRLYRSLAATFLRASDNVHYVKLQSSN